ncbi:MAG: MmcQ/YjbR family DNA-binding protein [Myxococcales bacterium]|nr:MmcQ/YjbR family DNA-binding protein [Myxococcales bacterium]
MNLDAYNEFCGSLPATSYVVQWGESHVWKVGGKVFAIAGNVAGQPAFTFKTTRGDFEVLCQIPGLRPAPYLASRGFSWVQHYAEPGLPDALLKEQLLASHKLVSLGLTKKLQRQLGLNQ